MLPFLSNLLIFFLQERSCTKPDISDLGSRRLQRFCRGFTTLYFGNVLDTCECAGWGRPLGGVGTVYQSGCNGTSRQVILFRCTCHPYSTLLRSVGNPEPDLDPQDPYVFGPPGSGSISQR
jgi:hypothetical protein